METRKQTRIRLRDRERNRRVVLIVGAALAVALLLVTAGIVSEFVIKPRSVLARVQEEPIVTREFWERTRLRKIELENQLQNLRLLSQQFGGQNIFASQIAQIETTLSSPLSLGTQVINEMIEDEVVRIKAEELGITVSEEEVDQALREQIARFQGAITEAQATATAEALAAATPTPTPTPVDEEEATETEPAPTPEPPPVLDDALYQEGLDARLAQLQEVGISLAEYQEIIRADLLREKLQEQIGAEEVEPTEEQIHVRHILIRVDEDEPDEEEPAEDETVTETDADAEDAATEEDATTDEEDAEAIAEEAGEEETVEDETRNDAEALALAQELRERILAGEDFAELAQEYSDDPGSAIEGGDLGWVGRGRFVPEFEEVAFDLPVGEISEPVRTDFGYHIVEVLERDEDRPKDEAQLQQERAQAFQTWLQQQIAEMDIERPENLPSRLPSDL